LRALLPAAERSGDASYLAQLLTQIARAQGLQREFDAAHLTLDGVERMLTDKLTVARIRHLLERGRVFNSSNKPTEARPLFLQAWLLALDANEDFYAVDAAHMLAIVESPDEAIRWNEKAMALAERSANEKAKNWLGSLYNNLGWAHHDKGDYAQALECFEKDIAWFTARGKRDEERVARWSVARTLRSLGRLDEALARQRELLAEQHAQKLDADGYVPEEIAECLHALGRADEAKPYFAEAHAQLSKDAWLVANEPQRIERLQQLSR
jgi:tetratricopeptide (TPR) repeat protein